jgi:fructose-1,6-bisphosphatase-3
MPPEQFQEFLRLIFYPAEVVERLEQTIRDPKDQNAYAMRMLHDLFEVVRVLPPGGTWMRHARSCRPKT